MTGPPLSSLRSEQVKAASTSAVILDRFPFSGVVYHEATIDRLAQSMNLMGQGLDGPGFLEQLETYQDVDVLFATWGMPAFTSEHLRALPKLKAIFYAAGEYRHLYTEACRERELTFCSAIEINSQYVAHQVFASIILALKGALRQRDQLRRVRDWDAMPAPTGLYQAKVGLVGLGRIGRAVAESLASLPVEVLIHDPYLDDEVMEVVGGRSVSMEELFAEGDVISLHLPGDATTTELIDRRLLSSMKLGSTLLNTSRGTVMKQEDLVDVLRQRPDLTALLDVCEPEPPSSQDPLYQLDNCYLTPHISGAIGRERIHMGNAMVEEALRWQAGQPLQYCVSERPSRQLKPSLSVAV